VVLQSVISLKILIWSGDHGIISMSNVINFPQAIFYFLKCAYRLSRGRGSDFVRLGKVRLGLSCACAEDLALWCYHHSTSRLQETFALVLSRVKSLK
jgi:hypothetical protein